MRKLIILTVFFFLGVAVLIPYKIRAESNTATPNISYETINLKDGYRYLVKRIKEKVSLLIFSVNTQKKLDFYEKLLNIRLAELKFVVDNRDITNIQVASQRYFTTAGQLTEFLKSKNELASNKESVLNLFSGHIKVIESLMGSYPDSTAEWRFLRDDANYLKDYSSLIK